MDLPLARMTHTPSSMMKITIDFDETSLPIVTFHCQKTVVMHMDLPLARMTYIPSTMMKITIDFDETSWLFSVTYLCQIMVVMRMDLSLARMTYIPSTWRTKQLVRAVLDLELQENKMFFSAKILVGGGLTSVGGNEGRKRRLMMTIITYSHINCRSTEAQSTEAHIWGGPLCRSTGHILQGQTGTLCRGTEAHSTEAHSWGGPLCRST